VLNDTKVLPAKFTARRATGGLVEGLFEREVVVGEWVVMLRRARHLRPGEPLSAEAPPRDPAPGGTNDETDASCERVTLRPIARLEGGRWCLAVDPPVEASILLGRIGRTPLPHYIRRGVVDSPGDVEDIERYQTIFARRPGAIAAPTAGLHLTEELIGRILDRGASVTTVTLHVGAGTFEPIRVDDLRDHRMHAEWFEVGGAAVEALRECRRRGGRVLAVGTTSVRVLESAADPSDPQRGIRAMSGWTELLIHPPYEFKVVDAMLTNFHLPRSTLLALVMAKAGVEVVRRAYSRAVERRYRFFSYGDAMLIV
jgi:S-adenosylmethionine:tRNA ribosyltransferase-isomerase